MKSNNYKKTIKGCCIFCDYLTCRRGHEYNCKHYKEQAKKYGKRKERRKKIDEDTISKIS